MLRPGGLPLTVRLLDPPLHEFLPHYEGLGGCLGILGLRVMVSFGALYLRVQDRRSPTLDNFFPVLPAFVSSDASGYEETIGLRDVQAKATVDGGNPAPAQGPHITLWIMQFKCTRWYHVPDFLDQQYLHTSPYYCVPKPCSQKTINHTLQNINPISLQRLPSPCHSSLLGAW